MSRILAVCLLFGTVVSQEPPDEERLVEIMAILRQGEEDTEAIQNLIPLGSVGLPAARLIIPQLKSRDPSHRVWVRTALVAMGEGVIPILRRTLMADAAIRPEVVETLSSFDIPSMELMTLFLEVRDDDDFQMQMAARSWLHNQNGPEHVPIWKLALSNPRLREGAIDILGQVVLDDEWRVLLAGLYSHLILTGASPRVISLLGRIPEEGAPLLIGIAQRPGPGRMSAMHMLASMGERAPGARELFMNLVADFDPRGGFIPPERIDITVVAVDALSRLETDRTEIVERLMVIHRAYDNSRLRRAIVDSLPNLGEAAEPALPLVTAELASPDAARRQRAAVGALRIQEAHPESVKLLREMLGGDDPVRAAAVAALIPAGDRANPLLEDLIALLDEELRALRLRVLLCLGAMGPAAEAALPAVRGLLEDEDPRIRSRAQSTVDAIVGR